MAEYSAERIALERSKIAASLDKERIESVLAALSKAGARESDLVEAKAKLTQKTKSDAMAAASRVEASLKSGAAAARTRGLVQLRELVLTAPIDYAKAAFVPNEGMLKSIAQRLQHPGTAAQDEAARNKEAWQLFVNETVPNSDAILGTYNEMVRQYGEPADAIDPRNTHLWKKFQYIRDKYDTEMEARRDFDQRMRTLTENPVVYAEWAQERNLDPEKDETYQKFSRDMGLDSLLPATGLSPFVEKLQKTVADPKSYSDELFRTDLDAGIKAAQNEQEYLKSLLPKDAAEETGDTFHDRLGAWVGRDDVRWWAEQHGYRLGRTVPMTLELQKEIDEGKYPGHVYGKYGVYIPGPDDMKAFEAAGRQLDQDPQRRLFRAAGLARGGQAAVEVDLRPPDALIQKQRGPRIEGMGLASDGRVVAKMSDGTWATSSDGKTWEPTEDPGEMDVRPVDGDTFPYDKGELPTKTVRGSWRPPRYGDAPGSVRLVDERTGKEVYIAPKDVQAQRMPGTQPGDRRPQPLDAIRKAQAKGVLERAGLVEKPPPLPGQAPPPVPPKPPDVSRLPAPSNAPPLKKIPAGVTPKAPVVDVAEATGRKQADEAMRKADEAIGMTREPAPPPQEPPPLPGQPPAEDPRKEALRRMKRRTSAQESADAVR